MEMAGTWWGEVADFVLLESLEEEVWGQEVDREGQEADKWGQEEDKEGFRALVVARGKLAHTELDLGLLTSEPKLSQSLIL